MAWHRNEKSISRLVRCVVWKSLLLWCFLPSQYFWIIIYVITPYARAYYHPRLRIIFSQNSEHQTYQLRKSKPFAPSNAAFPKSIFKDCLYLSEMKVFVQLTNIKIVSGRFPNDARRKELSVRFSRSAYFSSRTVSLSLSLSLISTWYFWVVRMYV